MRDERDRQIERMTGRDEREREREREILHETVLPALLRIYAISISILPMCCICGCNK